MFDQLVSFIPMSQNISNKTSKYLLREINMNTSLSSLQSLTLHQTPYEKLTGFTRIGFPHKPFAH